jgi:hypothetical protein
MRAHVTEPLYLSRSAGLKDAVMVVSNFLKGYSSSLLILRSVHDKKDRWLDRLMKDVKKMVKDVWSLGCAILWYDQLRYLKDQRSE